MTVQEAQEAARRVRHAYDRLGPGPKAILRRCQSANDVLAEGWFWRLLSMAEVERNDARWVARLVLCFPVAEHKDAPQFDLGHHLRKRLYAKVGPNDLPARAIAFRRLLAARDPEDLTHQMRRVLQRAAQPRDAGSKVDWAVLGASMMMFGDGVRRRWASTFYTPAADADATEGDDG